MTRWNRAKWQDSKVGSTFEDYTFEESITGKSEAFIIRQQSNDKNPVEAHNMRVLLNLAVAYKCVPISLSFSLSFPLALQAEMLFTVHKEMKCFNHIAIEFKVLPLIGRFARLGVSFEMPHATLVITQCYR